ncbi:MAG TPA: LamG domain-containing protein [Anaeromyxobacter sp.]
MTRSTLAALALALPLLAAAQQRPDLQRGLVASYRLAGDAMNDVTRIPANAIGTRPVEGHDGARNGALWFDGARAMVNLGAQLQPERFTLTAWVRPEAGDRPQVIVSKVRNLPGHYQKNFELRLNPGGRLFLYVPSGASWDGVEGQRPLPPGRWTHVAATYDGARAQLFIDGIPDGIPLAVRYEQTTTETFIGARPEGGGPDGRRPAGPTYLFAGGIDDVRIWDRPLTGEEIQIVSGRIPAPPEPVRPPPPHAQPAPPPPPGYGQPGPGPRGGAALLARYALDGDARESIAGADGALVGTRPAEDRDGNPRAALGFGGKDHVDLGARTEPERFSVAVWIRPTRAEKEQVIFSKATTAANVREKNLELRLDAFGRLVLVVPNASPFAKSVQAGERLPSGRWTHVAATYDGETGALYVDGLPAAQARIEPFEGSRGAAFVGARPDASGKRNRFSPGFDGRMDELRIYRGALSPLEVAALARGAGEVTGPPPRGGPGIGDDDELGPNEVLLVRVGSLLVRHDLACARGDGEALARVQGRIVSLLQDAERNARNDRELAEQLRRTAAEVQRLKGRTDAMSVDRVRDALARLTDGLWNDLVRSLDDAGNPAQPVPARRDW